MLPLLRRLYSTTVNPSEISHFSKLSAHWWDERGEFAFLHSMNPTRVHFITQKMREIALDEDPATTSIPPLSRANLDHRSPPPSAHDLARIGTPQHPLRGLHVLDIGCGGGLLTESLARLGAHTLGIDASAENIAVARHHASHDPFFSSSPSPQPPLSPGLRKGSLEYRHTTSEELLASLSQSPSSSSSSSSPPSSPTTTTTTTTPSPPRQYDLITALEVLEHVANPALFLTTACQLLRPGGSLVLSTIARTPLSYVLTILLAENVLRKVARGTHTWSQYVSPHELVAWFQKHPPAHAHAHAHAAHHDVLAAAAGGGGAETTTTTMTTTPWINPSAPTDDPARTEAEIRGLIYNPLNSTWILAPRGAPGTTWVSYIFWVRKPKV